MSHTIQTAGEAFFHTGYAEGTLFFFDFDGVLADQVEEKVFRLDEASAERTHIEGIAALAGIDASLYPNTGYLRHLVHQAQAYGFPVKPHTEAVEFARNLSDTQSPYFIITARSGFYAVQRMVEFCRHWSLHPQETFCLGRSSKADLLAKLRLDWPDRPFVFFEDSEHHIEAVKALGDPNLEVVQIEWPTCTASAEELRQQYLGI